jgi:hypothetical protein
MEIGPIYLILRQAQDDSLASFETAVIPSYDVFDADQARTRLVGIVNDAFQNFVAEMRTIMLGDDLPAHVAIVKMDSADMCMDISNRRKTWCGGQA